MIQDNRLPKEKLANQDQDEDEEEEEEVQSPPNADGSKQVQK